MQSKQREEQRESWSRARGEDAPKKGLNSRNSFERNEERGKRIAESDEMRAFGARGGGGKKERGGNNATIISGNNALIMPGTGYVHT